MIPRLFGWWRVSEAIAGQLTEPRRDVVESDEAVFEMIHSSRLFAIVQKLDLTLALAWRWSWVRQVSIAADRTWHDWSVTDRLRFVGRCVSCAALIVLLLQTVESAQGAPFRWILPLAFGIGGVLAELFAAAIIRRWKRERG
jgi:hypothetical protein